MYGPSPLSSFFIQKQNKTKKQDPPPTPTPRKKTPTKTLGYELKSCYLQYVCTAKYVCPFFLTMICHHYLNSDLNFNYELRVQGLGVQKYNRLSPGIFPVKGYEF